MRTRDPTHYLWWLVSRASGIVALVLVSLAVALGLAMAARLLPPRIKRSARRAHEQMAVVSLLAVVIHGVALLGDRWLRPNLLGISVPFVLSYRPAFTGIGVIAAYGMVLVGPTFYLRRRIGARVWRRLHRATVPVWVLAVIHTVGSGSDSRSLWLRAIVVIPVVPITYLFVARLAQRSPVSAGRRGRGELRTQRSRRRTPAPARSPSPP